MATTTHHLTNDKAHTITFLIDKDADQATVRDGQREATCTVAVARQFYRSLLDKGWEDPAAIERAMQRMEAEGDRAQTRREEAAKHAARTRMERMASAVKGVG